MSAHHYCFDFIRIFAYFSICNSDVGIFIISPSREFLSEVTSISPKAYYRFFFLAFFALAGYLSLKIVSPFLDSIVMGAVMAYLFYPIFERINKRLRKPAVSSALVCIIIILISFIPIFILGRAVVNEAATIYFTTKQAFSSQQLFSGCQGQTSLACHFQAGISSALAEPGVRDVINDLSQSLGHAVTTKITQTLYAVPDFLLFLFVSFFVSYYLFIDGHSLLTRIRKSVPIKPACQDLILSRMSALTRGVIFGTILLAIIQGIAGSIGFLILGLPQPFLWGVIMAITSLIPYIGTGLVWLPGAVVLVGMGSPSKGLLLALYGIFIISTIDNVFKPFVIGGAAKVHPLMALLGVLGGVALMGPLGFIVGPVILATFEALLEAYELEKKEIL